MESKQKINLPSIITKIFYNKDIMRNILTFLEEGNKKLMKSIFKKSGFKDKKKNLKEFIKKYIVDFGKHQEKLKYRISDDGTLIINTSIYNIAPNYLKEFSHVLHKETGDELELEKEDLYGYLKVLPKFDFNLINSKGDNLKLCKALVPYESDVLEDDDSEDKNKKYQMFYMNEIEENLPIDFSNKEAMIERQKKILELMNANKNQIF